MDKETIYQGLIDKAISPEELAHRAIRTPDLIPLLLAAMQEKPAAVRYGCQKALRIVVDEEPDLLAESFDLWLEMLEHQQNIFQWQALYMLAGLTSVVAEGRMEASLDRYFARITGPVMITANNAIKGSVRIVKAKPGLAEPVLQHILRAERGSYESQTCYEIVMGHAMKAFYAIRKWVQHPQLLYDFALRHQDYQHPLPKSAAPKLIARLGKDYSLAG